MVQLIICRAFLEGFFGQYYQQYKAFLSLQLILLILTFYFSSEKECNFHYKRNLQHRIYIVGVHKDTKPSSSFSTLISILHKRLCNRYQTNVIAAVCLGKFNIKASVRRKRHKSEMTEVMEI